MDFKKKKRVVVKIGSNSLTHKKTGKIDYIRIERLAMELSNLRNRGMDVCLVSSGAIALGRQIMGYHEKPRKLPEKQALASVGQASLMGIYQQFFSKYQQNVGQVLMTKNTVLDNVSRKNAQNTFEALFEMGIIPIVNANDTVSTSEIKIGDNDTLSAIVTALTDADLLILLSDIDGLYTGDPRKDPDAAFIPFVPHIDEDLLSMGSSSTGSDIGTGGMKTKLYAAEIATACGADMIIANAKDLTIVHKIIEGDFIGTHFKSNYDKYFDLVDLLSV
ncbi:MAG: glutamate 5-kinase [Lachnospiraceae bacterium]|nr:glutamate 5-kinase [Lachnospiraceae bacterium]